MEERTTEVREVGGSNPSQPTKSYGLCFIFLSCYKRTLIVYMLLQKLMNVTLFSHDSPARLESHSVAWYIECRMCFQSLIQTLVNGCEASQSVGEQTLFIK